MIYQMIRSYRLATCGVADDTQIHTHMCYSEFNDIMEAIAALDADVLTLEGACLSMEILKAFEGFSYPRQIGPGVYNSHSPRTPSIEEIEVLIFKMLHYIPLRRLWVNPDCGLKAREWVEVKAALINMVKASHSLREAESSNALESMNNLVDKGSYV